MKPVLHFVYRVCRGTVVFSLYTFFFVWCASVAQKRSFLVAPHALTHTLLLVAIAYGVAYACVTELWRDWKKKHG